MAFEVYDFKKETQPSIPMLKLSKSTIVFNKHMREQLKTGKVEIAFDKKQKTLRIKPVESNEEGVEIQKTKIAARGFFKHFGIEIQGSFEGVWDDKEQAFMVKIG